MTESDAQNTITSSPPRLGEIGRAVARNIRGLTDQLGLPSFASSLADAAQAHSTSQPAAAETGRAATTSTVPPTISAIRPGGRHLSAHEASPPVLPAASSLPGAVSTPATGPMQPSGQTPTLGVAAASDANLMLMASSQAASAVPTPNTRPAPTAPLAPTATPGTSAAPAITGSGTPRDPLVVPYGSSRADVSAAAAAVRPTATSEIKPLDLKEYPRPEKNDQTGVLSWSSSTPPTGKDLDRFISEARNRKAGYVTFEVDPGAVDQYDEVVQRLTDAGIQPVARVQDPYGDLPPDEVKQIVKDLSSQGVRYFELFDGGNVAANTPDNRVDVPDYAERWLAAARAVVDGGGLPGIGALAPGGDFDDRGFMRQLLSRVKEQGGEDILGRSWLALRGDTPGATAGSSDVQNLGDRAEWFDRINRHALGRSMPILATLDPAGRGERLAADSSGTSSGANTSAEQSERTVRDLRRKLPSLFGVNRGTVESARP